MFASGYVKTRMYYFEKPLWNGLVFLYSDHFHFLLLTSPHFFVLLWVDCQRTVVMDSRFNSSLRWGNGMKKVETFFFLMNGGKDTQLCLSLLPVSSQQYEGMWLGQHNKVGMVAVQNFELIPWFGDFHSIYLFQTAQFSSLQGAWNSFWRRKRHL